MQSSNAPNKIQLPFAANGTKNTIPVPSQQGVTPGAASFTDGFPPLTFTPLAAGGVPPSGADFNGILNMLSALQQWQSAGGFFLYDAAYSAAIGGYPRGAVLLNASYSGLWISIAENNGSNPDVGGPGWIAFMPHGVQTFTTSGNFFAPVGVTTVWVSGCGGGSGGGGGAGATPTPLNGAGGFAGSVAIMQPVVITLGSTVPVTIGSGGAGGQGGAAAGAGQPSGSGGSTSFGTQLILAGGASVPGGTSDGASFGYGTTSIVNVSGGSGYSFLLSSGVGQSGPFGLGGGAVATTYSAASNGKDASGYGAGGSGGGTSTVTGNIGGNGGNGAPGILIVEW